MVISHTKLTPSVSSVWHFVFGLLVSISLIVLHYATGLRSLLFGIPLDRAELELKKLQITKIAKEVDEGDRHIVEPTREQVDQLVFDKGWPFYAKYETSEARTIAPREKNE